MLTLAALPHATHADSGFDEPLPGTALRRALMSALRPSVERAYQQRVRFSVRALQASSTLAVVFVEPLDSAGRVIGETASTAPNGKPLQLDGWVFAILKCEEGKWRVVELDLASDFEGLDVWPAKYPAIPNEVFDAVGMATNAEG